MNARSLRRSPRIARVSLALLLVCVSSCTTTRSWSELDRPWSSASFEGADAARVTLSDGRSIELERPCLQWESDRAFVSGQRVSSSTASGETQRIPLERISSIETRGRVRDPLLHGLLVLGEVVLLLGVIVLAYQVFEYGISFGG